VPFEGKHGLFSDLKSGEMPNSCYVVPNQSRDRHGRGNAGPACEYDPNDIGSQAGLNPGLIYEGDLVVETLVNTIHQSRAWHEGRNVIIVTWDENGYSVSPTINKVLSIVETNYGDNGVASHKYYNHFSLFKTMEAGRQPLAGLQFHYSF
jgi:hypothetical protein